MRILGVDPGFAITGYSIIDYIGNKFHLETSGAVLTEAHTSFPLRLEKINKELDDIIKTYKPDAMAIEELFFNNNAKTAINVAQARGVILMTARINALDIFEYTPLQIKQALTGNGRAEKKQIQFMVKSILGLDKIPKPDDAADALAVALTHLQTNNDLVDNSIN